MTAICGRCRGAYGPATCLSTVRVGRKILPRVPFGREKPLEASSHPLHRCSDCGRLPDGVSPLNCDGEECPYRTCGDCGVILGGFAGRLTDDLTGCGGRSCSSCRRPQASAPGIYQRRGPP